MREHNHRLLIAGPRREVKVSSQFGLKEKWRGRGYGPSASSISWDLKRLGVVKVKGFYKAPSTGPGDVSKIEQLDATTAGDHMIVLKTQAGHAHRMAVLIDEANISGLLGTIAGDDTIFIAVGNRLEQNKVLRRILGLFE